MDNEARAGSRQPNERVTAWAWWGTRRFLHTFSFLIWSTWQDNMGDKIIKNVIDYIISFLLWMRKIKFCLWSGWYKSVSISCWLFGDICCLAILFAGCWRLLTSAQGVNWITSLAAIPPPAPTSVRSRAHTTASNNNRDIHHHISHSDRAALSTTTTLLRAWHGILWLKRTFPCKNFRRFSFNIIHPHHEASNVISRTQKV